MYLAAKHYLFAQPRFGKGLIMDIGASQGGSLKLQETDNDGVPTAQSRNYKIPPFWSKDEFLSNIKQLVDQYNQTPEIQSTNTDHQLDKLVVFAPGLPTKEQGVFSAFSNLKQKNGHILRNIDFNRLKDLLAAPKAQVLALSDVVGGFADAVSQIAQKQPRQLFSGQKITFTVTGGGLGMVDGVIRNRELQIACSEAGTILDEVKGTPVELSQTSVTALTRNFADYLRQHDRLKLTRSEIRQLPGKAVTDYQEAQKHIPGITPEQHQKASEAAIRNFLNGLVKAYHIRVNSGTKMAILGGPVLDGIKQYMEANPQSVTPEIQAYAKHFPDRPHRPILEKVFLESLYSRLSPAKKTFFMRNHFDVITELPIANNTSGAKYVLQGKRDPHEYYFNIPLSAFKLKTD